MNIIPVRPASCKYTIRLDHGIRNDVAQQLKEASISTMVYYPIPLNRQLAVGNDTSDLDEGEAALKAILSIPMHPHLNTGTQTFIGR